MSVEIQAPFVLTTEEVSLDRAEAVKLEGVRIIQQQPGPFSVDLGSLTQANSVTVALLVAWYRHASLNQKSIKFVNLSEELHNIIEFSGLSQVLLPNN